MNHLKLLRGVAIAQLWFVAFSLAGCGSSSSGGGDAAEDDAASNDAHVERDTGSDATTHRDGGKGNPEDSGKHDAEPDAKESRDSGSMDATQGDAKPSPDSGRLDAATDQDSAPPQSVTFAVNMNAGPARQFDPPSQPTPVSPYVYGINTSGLSGGESVTPKKTRWGLVRTGHNAFTDWNWTTNYLNLGNTSCFWQGQAAGGSALAGAITQSVDSIAAVQGEGAATLATVPILDYVSAASVNDTTATCPAQASNCAGGTASSTAVNTGNLDFASTDPASTAFVGNAAHKPGAYCACAPGQPCATGCTVSTNPVYQDEFVSFIGTTYGAGGGPIFFDLDNEPNYWGFTHPELWPFTGTLPCETAADVTYDDIVNRDVTYARSVKAAWPTTKVFGPVVAQDGLVYAHVYPDANWPTEFLDYYLTKMAAAGSEAGTPILDALDVQYYNFQNSSSTQCLQNPRMFWDPNYTELSPAGTDAVDFQYSGLNNYFDTAWYPRQLVPRLLHKIENAYGASTAAPQLALSEYNSGCETAIEGAIAEADDLGIFGREDVFAGSLMPQMPQANNYAFAAFDLYRNYDGNGAVVGDTAVRATTTNVEFTSVYAFAHSTDAAAVDVVALNKAPTSVVAHISIANAPGVTGVTAYQIVDGAASVVAVGGTAPTVTCTGGTCTLVYMMPATSATTLILR